MPRDEDDPYWDGQQTLPSTFMDQYDIIIDKHDVDKNGRVAALDLRAGVVHIAIADEVENIVIDQNVIAPGACLWLWSDTNVEIRGNAKLQLIVVNVSNNLDAGPARITIHGNLTTSGPIITRGHLHVIGSIRSGDCVDAGGTIRCNGSLTAGTYVAADGEIFVNNAIAAPAGVGCNALTIYSKAPAPKVADPDDLRPSDRYDFRAPMLEVDEDPEGEFGGDPEASIKLIAGPFRRATRPVLSMATRTQLRRNAEAWRYNAEISTPDEFTPQKDLPLCEAFLDSLRPDNGPDSSTCKGCPVFENTGKRLCRGTPIRKASQLFDIWKGDPANDAHKLAYDDAASDVVDYLKDLVPPVYILWPGSGESVED